MEAPQDSHRPKEDDWSNTPGGLAHEGGEEEEKSNPMNDSRTKLQKAKTQDEFSSDDDKAVANRGRSYQNSGVHMKRSCCKVFAHGHKYFNLFVSDQYDLNLWRRATLFGFTLVFGIALAGIPFWLIENTMTMVGIAVGLELIVCRLGIMAYEALLLAHQNSRGLGTQAFLCLFVFLVYVAAHGLAAIVFLQLGDDVGYWSLAAIAVFVLEMIIYEIIYSLVQNSSLASIEKKQSGSCVKFASEPLKRTFI